MCSRMKELESYVREPMRLSKALEFATDRHEKLKAEFEEYKRSNGKLEDELKHTKSLLQLKEDAYAESRVQLDNYKKINTNRDEIISKLGVENVELK